MQDKKNKKTARSCDPGRYIYLLSKLLSKHSFQCIEWIVALPCTGIVTTT